MKNHHFTKCLSSLYIHGLQYFFTVSPTNRRRTPFEFFACDEHEFVIDYMCEKTRQEKFNVKSKCE